MSCSFRLITLLCLLTPTIIANSNNRLVSEKGILDLRELEFDRNTVVSLNGEWEFYWNEFLYPVDFDSDKQPTPDYYGKIPSYWTSYDPDNCDITGQGYATYRLKILLPYNFREEIIFDIPVFDAAFDLYLDYFYAGGNGTPGISKQDSEAGYSPFMVNYTPVNDTLQITVLVSNYQHRRGGFWKSMRIGHPEKLTRFENRYKLISIISLGVLLSFSLFFFFFFIFFREDKTLLFFSMALVGIFIRLMCTDTYTISLLSDISWEWMIRFEYLGSFFTLLFGMWYLYALYPAKILYQLTRLNTLISAIFLLAILFFKVELFSYSMFYFEPAAMAFLLYYLYASGRNSMRGKKTDMIYFSGLVILLFALVNDILLANSETAIFYKYTTHFAIQIFVFLQSIMLIFKWILTYKENERLTSEIKYININLERLVEERTGEVKTRNKEISSQNTKIASQNKKLQEALDFKNRIFSIIAHDLRSPVANLIQITELLKEDSFKSEDKKFRISANELAKSAGELIDNLLYWGGSQGDQIRNNPDSCDISGIVSEVFNIFNEMARQKSINLKYISKREKYAFCDRELIMIVIRNLVSNALKFTHKDGMVSITTSPHPDKKNMILIIVKDTGIGIPEDKIENLFGSDKLESMMGTASEKGTGLGLRLCKELVHLNKGTIKVKSSLETGTIFSISLPGISTVS
ncbi:MAG: sensor histidine kinase [Bacteroidetes bacterium]|nr:sensor histidine kinase [Bacteroidota bacterium]